MKFRKLVVLFAGLFVANTSFAHGDESAIGVAGDVHHVDRSVSVEMADTMRFTPSNIAVRQGETIRFIVRNSGLLKHEMVLGTEPELKEHDELMKKFPEMEHAEPQMLTLAPGKIGEMVWHFTRSGKVNFACLEPGHYEAGMKGLITVADAKDAPIADDMTEGEVRKIDKDSHKITIKHGEIKSLGMPAMTMVFLVTDPAMLDAVKPGDKVRFVVERIGGAMKVTRIEATN